MNLLRKFWLSLVCPKFYEDLPKNDDDQWWVAVAIRTNPFSSGREIYTKKVLGLHNAYFTARRLAWKLDKETPYADGELGINWVVRKPVDGEKYYSK